ncbi:MAG: peptidoglycan-binding protein [Myxococcales bacterium]|nr:peptidoglycan-binding protein [Myxococcales bacterium]MDH3842628.1 peptidoglycan-binding protein [Myxococcales bacterium]
MADDNIKALQEALDICGYKPGKHDGMMGRRTRNAIRDFQKDAGVDVDGDVGPQTRGALSKKLSEVAVRAQHLAGFLEGGGASVEDDL